MGNHLSAVEVKVDDMGNRLTVLQDTVVAQGSKLGQIEVEVTANTRAVSSMDTRLLSLENRISMYQMITIATLIAGMISLVVAVFLK